ncbi:hypothetical protein KAJ27_16025 [bacterium]|nr:hypothetical protein [bacterium]
MKKRFKKYVSVLVVFVFMFQVLTFSGSALGNEKITEEMNQAMNHIGGQVSHMKDLCESMGKEVYVENLKKNLMSKRSAIIENIMNEVKKEGLEKVESELKQLGPIGKNISSDLAMCKTEAQKYEMIRMNLNYHLGILVKKIGEMKEEDIKEELTGLQQRIHDTTSGKEIVSEGKREPLISFKSMGAKDNTEGLISGVFKITFGIFKFGVSMFIFLLNGIVFIVKGMIPLAIFMLSIGVGLIKIPVKIVLAILGAVF